MRNIFLIFLLFALMGCKSNDLNLEIFLPNVQGVLNTILEKNDSIISSNYSEPVAESYFKYTQNLAPRIFENGSINKFFTDSIYCDSLYIYKIFNFEGRQQFGAVRHPRDLEKTYSLNFYGPYLSYLKLLGKQNKTIETYYEHSLSNGSVDMSIYPLVRDLTLKDLKNENVRLVLGIHLLLFNDSYPRNEKFMKKWFPRKKYTANESD